MRKILMALAAVLILSIMGVLVACSTNGNNGKVPGIQDQPIKSAEITNLVGGTIRDYELFLKIPNDSEMLSLSPIIICSDNASWRLYSDASGQTEIPTKIATNLVEGNNIFYILVTSKDGSKENTYVLTIHRIFTATIRYNHNNIIINVDYIETGSQWTVKEVDIIGYTVKGWKDKSGHTISSKEVWES